MHESCLNAASGSASKFPFDNSSAVIQHKLCDIFQNNSLAPPQRLSLLCPAVSCSSKYWGSDFILIFYLEFETQIKFASKHPLGRRFKMMLGKNWKGFGLYMNLGDMGSCSDPQGDAECLGSD